MLVFRLRRTIRVNDQAVKLAIRRQFTDGSDSNIREGQIFRDRTQALLVMLEKGVQVGRCDTKIK